ncbi:MAG: hypothetical protein ABJA86_14165 [Nocardioidaceae bacterium]
MNWKAGAGMVVPICVVASAAQLAPGRRGEVAGPETDLLSIEVVNSGPMSVRIESASFPLLGIHADSAVRIVGPGLTSSPDSVDAIFPIDRVLDPGAKLELSYGLRFRPSGCDGLGNLAWISDVPLIKVSALGLTGTRHGDAIFGWWGTPASSCDDIRVGP